MLEKYCFDGSQTFEIRKAPTKESSGHLSKEDAEKKMAENEEKLYELQKKLFAEKKEGLIVLFQAMDAAGKDGTIEHVMTCLSPHGVYEASFKSPSSVELAHDFLWRVAQKVPAKGEIAVFNRSQYEDVLIGKVKHLYLSQAHADRINLDHVIRGRYEDIRNFETYLFRNSVRTLKIFLHVSNKEQARRLLSRIEEPEKNWKFSASDVEERQYWDEYQQAFEDAINATATPHCPWYVVPADEKWYMRYLVSEILLHTMKKMDPKYPQVTRERLAEFGGWQTLLEQELSQTKDD